MEIPMTKRLFVLLILTFFLLAACNGEEQSPIAESPTPKTESLPEQAAPVDEKPTETTPVEETSTDLADSKSGGSDAAAGMQMECTLVSDQPDAPAELVAIFGVTEDDWVKGSDSAAVTFVEYSDFQ
jgi:hypothetical protein